MDTRQIDAVLDLLTEEELDATLRWIDVLERWDMSGAEAEEWRRRIQERGNVSRLSG